MQKIEFKLNNKSYPAHRVYHINFADDNFRRAQKINSKSAIRFGCTASLAYCPSDIDINFFNAHKEILSAKRGAGYWLWKPYFILKTLRSTQNGDYIIYTDSGIEFMDDVSFFIKHSSNSNPVVCFELEDFHSELKWSKKKLISCLNAEEFINTPQRLGGIHFILNCDLSRRFYEELLSLCSINYLIDDSVSEDESDFFIEHRHDQSVFSLLSKIYGFTSFRDPTQFGNARISLMDGDYPQVFNLFRDEFNDYWLKIKLKNLRKRIFYFFRKYGFSTAIN